MPPRPAPPAPKPTAKVPAETVADGPAPAKDARVLDLQIVGPDGEPLPPDIARELQDTLSKNLPPVVKSAAPPVTSPAPGPATATGPAINANGDILVTGQRPRGSVVGDIPAERTLSLFDIRAYGASDIGELLDALGPQVRSSRGREDNGPVVLLNGRRVSGFDEIAKIPTEAIERMEVFPEELALKYGYRADQKVVNVVTFERYTSKVGQAAYTVPTDGGRDAALVNANFLHIAGATRFTFDADYNRAGSLLESERGVAQRPGTPDLGRFRTLVPATAQLALNGTVSAEVLGDVSSTLNARFETTRSDSLVGRGLDRALERDVDKRVAHLGTTLGGTGAWLWSFTGNYDRTTTTDTRTDTGRGAQDTARSVDARADGALTLNGSVVKLPAGPVSTSLGITGETRDFSSRSLRGGVARNAMLARDRAGIQIDVDVPIASRAKPGLGWLGALSVNANLALESLSDLGSLRTFGYGVRWSPIVDLDLVGSVTDEQGAPTVEQLGAPLVVTPNVSAYDFARRESVDATRVYGGNAGLRSDDRHVVRWGLNAKPFAATELRVSVDYIRTRIDNPIAGFPIVTPEIEAAFPERFTRDGGGRLVQIDTRPLNFRRSDKAQVRWGLTFMKPIGAVPPGLQNAKVRYFGNEGSVQSSLPPGARIIRPEAGSAMARRFENMSSRFTFSLYYTWHVKDEILARDGVPVLNLLDGSAIGSRGGVRRHEVQLQASAFKRGLGARVTVNWQSGTTVRGLSAGVGGTDGDLNFASYATANVNLFANLADRLGGSEAPAWLKGLRATVSINNLFNTRPIVRDGGGATPLSYQAAYLDPVGRSVSIGLRKVF